MCTYAIKHKVPCYVQPRISPNALGEILQGKTACISCSHDLSPPIRCTHGMLIYCQCGTVWALQANIDNLCLLYTARAAKTPAVQSTNHLRCNETRQKQRCLWPHKWPHWDHIFWYCQMFDNLIISTILWPHSCKWLYIIKSYQSTEWFLLTENERERELVAQLQELKFHWQTMMLEPAFL